MKRKGNKIMRVLKIAAVLTILFFLRGPVAFGLFVIARACIMVADLLTTV
jgi:hypothetical protein